MLAAGIAKGLGQVCFPCVCRANEGQVTVGIDAFNEGRTRSRSTSLPLSSEKSRFSKVFGALVGSLLIFSSV